MKELDRSRYEKVRTLFESLAAYNVSIPALLDGVNPGTIYVDDLDSPQAAFMQSVEGHHLAGDAANDSFVTALNAYLRETCYNDDITVEGHAIYCCVHPEAWKEKLPAVFHPRQVFILRRRHYVCTALAYTHWHERIPEGYSVRRIDDDLLDTPGLDIPDHIRGWINDNWGTRENYRQHGFGFCTVHEDRVVSWSVADCTSDTRCEIGIQTRPDYRRQGLAAITAAAAVDHAFATGFTEVGWHCNDDNIGSWKTAERVGFIHEHDYLHYYCFFSSVHELAELGWTATRTGHYHDAVAAYDQRFAISSDFPAYVYYTAARAHAALHHQNQSLAYLNVVIDRDWTDGERTQPCEEFTSLHGTVGWKAAPARMKDKRP